MEYADDPVTSLIIVENLSRLPSTYRPLSVSLDEGKRGNLWPDSFFDKSQRFLCYSKSTNVSENGMVVADIAVTRDGESPPPGFTQIEVTHDSRQKALKKNSICVKLAKPETISTAVLELALFSKEKKPRPEFTMAGEVNGFNISFKSGPFRSNTQNNRAQSYIAAAPNYFTALPPGPQNSLSNHASVPAAFAYGANGGAYGAVPMNGASYGYAPSTMQRQDSHSSSALTPLSGVPFTLNERFANAMRSKRNLVNTTIDESLFSAIKTVADLDREYSYPFTEERSVLASMDSA